MTRDECVNCQEPSTGEYDLLLRSHEHESVPLCDECRQAIEAETGQPL